jgi:3-deoxy-manno-octulosonate cytidylyltransferase (CMP-KDO synthetase)
LNRRLAECAGQKQINTIDPGSLAVFSVLTMKIAAIIPARYESTRFRGKPLAPICGRAMIQWVYEAARQCDFIDQVVIATDNGEIRAAAQSFGARVCMTAATHATGTDRVAEASETIDADIIINLQGDEPLIAPEAIRQAVAPLLEDSSLVLSTLKTRITDESDPGNPHVVKVVTDANDCALYFSRAPIPFRNNTESAAATYRHIGLYVFRKDFLRTFTRLPRTILEQCENLEQLRAIEHGYRIKVPTTDYQPIGVDTPEDVARVENILRVRESRS